jgi:colanic acid biosynthesis glycosyl transferase WcaI
MRILLVGLNYAPEVVGIGPYTTELAEHFAASGHKVSVLTSFPYYPHWRIDTRYERKRPFLVEMINGVRVIRSPILLPGRKQSAFRRILFDSSQSVTALAGSVGVGRVDTVICVSPPLQLGVTAWLIARSRGARFLLHLQDLVPDAALSVGLMREGAAAGIARRLERFVYTRADLITVISQGFLDNLVCKGVATEKLRLLPNWVETGRFRAVPDPAVREALGAPDGETLVLHTGNMGAKQGLETVVDAAAELEGERVVLTLIGDGSNRAALQRRAAGLSLTNIRFLPLQSDLPATLAAADVLVLAQRGAVVDSVAPSKLLSYMAAGKPIVASVNERSEAGQMIRRAKCGVVVAPEQPRALADALRDLHRRPDSYHNLGPAGRRHVAEHYERSRVLEQWTRLAEAQTRGTRPRVNQPTDVV